MELAGLGHEEIHMFIQHNKINQLKFSMKGAYCEAKCPKDCYRGICISSCRIFLIQRAQFHNPRCAKGITISQISALQLQRCLYIRSFC